VTQSLAQKRAKDALGKIRGLRDDANSDYGNYVSFVKALPATIIMTGLGQALAMEKAGKKKGHDILYKHMNDWLCNNNNNGWKNSPYRNKNDVLEAITVLNENDYIRAQAEAMEYLEWLKKFAVAYLVEKDNAVDEEADDAAAS